MTWEALEVEVGRLRGNYGGFQILCESRCIMIIEKKNRCSPPSGHGQSSLPGKFQNMSILSMPREGKKRKKKKSEHKRAYRAQCCLLFHVFLIFSFFYHVIGKMRATAKRFYFIYNYLHAFFFSLGKTNVYINYPPASPAFLDFHFFFSTFLFLFFRKEKPLKKLGCYGPSAAETLTNL